MMKRISEFGLMGTVSQAPFVLPPLRIEKFNR